MRYSMNMQNPLKKATETMTDVSVASRKVAATTDLAAVALLTVVGVSFLALTIAVIALGRSGNAR